MTPLRGALTWPRPGTAPTERDLVIFAAFCTMGGKEAARALGVSRATIHRHLTRIYRRLGVGCAGWGAIEAAMALGWMEVPDQLVALLPERSAA